MLVTRSSSDLSFADSPSDQMDQVEPVGIGMSIVKKTAIEMPKIAAICGDGIGKEIIPEAIKALRAINKKFNGNLSIDEYPFGADHYLTTRETFPASAYEKWLEQYDAVLLGALGDPRVPDNRHADDILLGMRRKMDLYVNYRPARLLHPSLSPLKEVSQPIDLHIFRENTEELYIHAGGVLKPGQRDEVVVENAIHTRLGVQRVVHAAFLFAQTAGLGSVTLTDKANVLKYSGKLWQRVFDEEKRLFPSVRPQHRFIDALCMDLVRAPESFEVIVASNMFGDIISDLAAQLVGGLGITPSRSFNPEHRRFRGLFEPVHGSAPDIAGRSIANPLAAIRSAAMILTAMELPVAADTVEQAVCAALSEQIVTPDLGGICSTVDVGDFICDFIQRS